MSEGQGAKGKGLWATCAGQQETSNADNGGARAYCAVRRNGRGTRREEWERLLGLTSNAGDGWGNGSKGGRYCTGMRK